MRWLVRARVGAKGRQPRESASIYTELVLRNMTKLQVEHSTRHLAIHRPGLLPPLLVQNAPKGKRPFIHPILAPDGIGEITENEPGHHRWQHGLYVGLNAVNGFGFWTEGLNNNPLDGSFHPEPLSEPVPSSDGVSWKVKTGYRTPDGKALLTETQHWTLEDRESFLVLDAGWNLQAETDLQFGAYSYGGLFLRMPWRAETHGEILTSEGAISVKAAEGQRARWVAIAMPIPGREHGPAGFAFFDHPSNPEFPNPWRVDGNLGVVPSRSIAGPWELAAGKTVTNRYRLVAFTGAIDANLIAAQWEQFSVS